MASAAIQYGIRAKMSRVQDPAHAVLKKGKENPVACTDPTLRTKIV